MSTDLIYLDYASTTPIDERVFLAMQPFFSETFYNPSATYNEARKVRRSLELARSQVAYWLGSKPSEIIFTAGATEANNIAIRGIMDCFEGANIVVSAIEHGSVLLTARLYDCREVGVSGDGIIELDDLERQIDEQTVLVSIMYANNEIGTVQPVREASKLINKIRRERAKKGNNQPLYLHTDAAQAGNYLDLHTARLGVDLLSLNGSKIYGPKQSGLLFVKAGVELKPLMVGGGQERNLRSGTENVAGCIGLAKALDLVQQDRHQEVTRLSLLQRQFFDGFKGIKDTKINGSLSRRLPSNVHATIAGQDNERLLIALDEMGIMAAAGSACSASDEEPSHVLRALGLSDDQAQSSLRFTMGHGTTKEHIETTIKALSHLVSNKH